MNIQHEMLRKYNVRINEEIEQVDDFKDLGVVVQGNAMQDNDRNDNWIQLVNI